MNDHIQTRSIASLLNRVLRYFSKPRFIAALLGMGMVVGVSAQRLDNPLSQDLRWRNIGPANMMGRIAAVDALHTDYRHVICATASGGVFKSTNGGLTWLAIFDRYGTGSIGAVALFQNDPDVIWVGTGEAANRNSSGWGDGLYRSTDGGQSFQKLGLEDTHHIAEIALHPTDPDIAYVAAVGHLWGYGGDRGLYKTEDGGQSWTQLTQGLPTDERSGCTEIIMHPTDPQTLYAGFYERLREPYWYTSGGPQGGLFKSTDGGQHWRKLHQGLPVGETGMIDISICLSQPNIMVAAVETHEHLPEGQPGSGVYRSDDGGESWTFLLHHAVRPFYHGQIEIDPVNPDNIYVVSRDFRISNDGGKSFYARRWRTDGGDDHDMWIAPHDNRIMYLCTDQGLRLSVDGGETILSFNNMAIGQYYAIGVDMRDPYWVGGGLQDNGLWIGPSNSRERRGILNEHNTWVGEGDGFHFQIDPTDWKTLYLVNHVGFAVRLNLATREHNYITPTPETIHNFADHFDPDFPDSAIQYTINPGEHWFYYEQRERPTLPPQFRFNWSSPLVLSSNNPHTIYFGGNHVFKSIDRGEHWRIISPDLSGNDPRYRNPSRSGHLTNSVTGGENHFTIVTLAESPVDEAIVWAGTDDGYVHVTRDGGASWLEVGRQLPAHIPRRPPPPGKDYGGAPWVSRVTPSSHQAGRCYVTLDNHRYDDMAPYVLMTEDYGLHWTDITSNLPSEYSAYVIREDPINPDLLFVGTEVAVHFSYDRGKNWHELMAGMPTVAIHDLIIHPREGDLIAGTHGRSIWILDDIRPLREMHDSILSRPLHLFSGKTGTKWHRINTGRKQPYFEFHGENPAYGVPIQFYVKDPPRDSVLIEINDPYTGMAVDWIVPGKAGINRTYWNFRFPTLPEQVTAMRQQLHVSIQKIEPLLSRPALQDTLATIRRDLQATPDRPAALNDIRRRLIRHFAGYAGGQPVFGEKLGHNTAAAGRYRLSVTVNGHTARSWIAVRDDPSP